MRSRAISTTLAAAVAVLIIGVAAVGYYATMQGSGPIGNSTTPTTSTTGSAHTSSTATTSASGIHCSTGGSGSFAVSASYDGGFSPTMLTIAVGQSVTWTNTEGGVYAYSHTVTSETGAFSSPTLDSGQSFTCVFNHTGTYQYHCSFHSFMTGTIEVGP
ncbi:MAG: cupredoxin domain-containing protein [Thaumarchaeota archaeon]|nr:cupredoxin domain-containing protein [Nitrososphaerota archaeon]